MKIQERSGATDVTQNSSATTLQGFLRTHGQGEASEEELFAALVGHKLAELKGDEGKAAFEQALGTDPLSTYVPLEDKAKSALEAMVSANTLSEEEANTIYTTAFHAAQLDGNTEYLFDHLGGSNDPTKATMGEAAAIEKALAALSSYEQTPPSERTFNEPTPSKGEILSGGAPTLGVQGTVNPSPIEKGGSGFLYKPVSESDGKLVVLTPTNLTGSLQSVRLVGPDGSVIEDGRYSGLGNGGREHFRFSKAGSEYPDSLTVEVLLTSGETMKYLIPQSEERHEE